MPMSWSLFSISKHLGADMSSKFMPPNTGEIYFIVFIISSVFCVSKHIGNASIPANDLNIAAFPSITGNAASGPMFPSPKTALPSVITATEFCFIVYSLIFFFL